jgi:hypothetical protein
LTSDGSSKRTSERLSISQGKGNLRYLNPDSVLKIFQGKYRVNYSPDFSTIPPNFEGKYKIEINYHFGATLTDQITFILTISKYNTM